jgi:hypothetical protein
MQPDKSCSLDVAERGETTSKDIGPLISVTMWEVILISRGAFKKAKKWLQAI